MDAGATPFPINPVEIALADPQAACAAGTTSEALSTIFLDRIAAFDPHCNAITPTSSEGDLLAIAYDYETATRHRKTPTLMTQS